MRWDGGVVGAKKEGLTQGDVATVLIGLLVDAVGWGHEGNR